MCTVAQIHRNLHPVATFAERKTGITMPSLSSLPDPILLLIFETALDALDNAILEWLCRMNTDTSLVPSAVGLCAFLYSSKHTLNLFRLYHKDAAGLRELFKILQTYVKAKTSNSRSWEQRLLSREWQNEREPVPTIPSPVSVSFGAYVNRDSYNASVGMDDFLYLNGPVDFQAEPQQRPNYSYRYIGIKEMKWNIGRAILGENFMCLYVGKDIFRNEPQVEGRNARNMFNGVNVYGLTREISDEIDYYTDRTPNIDYYSNYYSDTHLETYVILPSGSKWLDSIADNMIRFIENTTTFKRTSKVSIQFGSPDTEVGYIRTTPYTTHPMENVRTCHYPTFCGVNGLGCVGCNNVEDIESIEYKADGTVVVRYPRPV